MLSSFRSISALGDAPVCAGTPVLAGATVRIASAVVRAVWNPVFAAEAPAAVVSMTMLVSEVAAGATGADAAAMAA